MSNTGWAGAGAGPTADTSLHPSHRKVLVAAGKELDAVIERSRQQARRRQRAPVPPSSPPSRPPPPAADKQVEADNTSYDGIEQLLLKYASGLAAGEAQAKAEKREYTIAKEKMWAGRRSPQESLWETGNRLDGFALTLLDSLVRVCVGSLEDVSVTRELLRVKWARSHRKRKVLSPDVAEYVTESERAAAEEGEPSTWKVCYDTTTSILRRAYTTLSSTLRFVVTATRESTPVITCRKMITALRTEASVPLEAYAAPSDNIEQVSEDAALAACRAHLEKVRVEMERTNPAVPPGKHSSTVSRVPKQPYFARTYPTASPEVSEDGLAAKYGERGSKQTVLCHTHRPAVRPSTAPTIPRPPCYKERSRAGEPSKHKMLHDRWSEVQSSVLKPDLWIPLSPTTSVDREFDRLAKRHRREAGRSPPHTGLGTVSSPSSTQLTLAKSLDASPSQTLSPESAPPLSPRDGHSKSTREQEDRAQKALSIAARAEQTRAKAKRCYTRLNLEEKEKVMIFTKTESALRHEAVTLLLRRVGSGYRLRRLREKAGDPVAEWAVPLEKRLKDALRQCLLRESYVLLQRERNFGLVGFLHCGKY